jgi:transposase
VIDLLEDREAGSVFAWLKRHPDIRGVARDRSGAYAEAAATGAPQAMQLADCWHLLSRERHGGSPALCRAQSRRSRTAAQRVMQTQRIDASVAESSRSISALLQRRARIPRAPPEKRYARYRDVMELHWQGVSKRGIARALSINRATVRKFLRAGRFP